MEVEDSLPLLYTLLAGEIGSVRKSLNEEMGEVEGVGKFTDTRLGESKAHLFNLYLRSSSITCVSAIDGNSVKYFLSIPPASLASGSGSTETGCEIIYGRFCIVRFQKIKKMPSLQGQAISGPSFYMRKGYSVPGKAHNAKTFCRHSSGVQGLAQPKNCASFPASGITANSSPRVKR